MAATASIETPPTRGPNPPNEDDEAGLGGSGPEAHYRPYLDGLRAIAVYLVLLFHAGVSRAAGGFVGVDVFFVLSGYLVTQLLLRDITGTGSVRFARFYARRYRRLLPAAFVALLVTAMVYVGIASPANVAGSVNAFKSAFLYVANWFFIGRSTAYFGGNIAQNPVLPYWSLAVEEQFYLLWPLLLAGGFLLTRRFGEGQRRALRIGVAVAAGASLLAAFLLRGGSPTHAYYGTDTRAYQLLAGALIALTPGLVARVGRFGRRARALVPVSVIALLVLASSWVHLDAIGRGAAVAVTTVVLIGSLEATEGGAVKRFLASGPVVYLGKISYGTYLWHWPVILVITELLHLSTLTTAALTCLIATSVASLSFQLLEVPVRTSRVLDRYRRPVIAAGLAISVVSALVFIPAILSDRSAAARATQGNTSTGFTPVPRNLDFADAVFTATLTPPVCFGRPADACTIVHGHGRHLLLLGDSHARMLIPTFTRIAKTHDLTLSVVSLGGCPWQRRLYTPTREAQCKRDKEDAYKRVIPDLHPDLVIAINYGYDDPSVPPFPVISATGRAVARGSVAFNNLMTETTDASVKALTADAKQLLIIEPTPLAREDPTACLVHSKFLEDCRYVARVNPSKLELLYRKLDAGSDRIRAANFDRFVCPFLPICDPVIDGHIVKVDTQHLTRDFADYIAPEVADYLVASHLIPRSP